MSADHTKNRLGKNILSLGIVQIANYILPLITIPIISSIIGPHKFGIINFVQAFVAYFTLLIGYGFDLTATRRLAANPTDVDKRNRVFSEVLYAQGMLLFVSAVIFTICLALVPQLRSEWLVSIFTFLTCISTFLVQNWLFQAMQDLQKVAILNFVSKFIFTILIILIIKKESDYIWYALALSASQVIVAIASFVWSIKKYKLKFYKIDILSSLRLLWHEKTYFFSLVVINLYTTTNIVLLGILTDYTQVGYYTAGQKLSFVVITILILPFRQTFFPYMSKQLNMNAGKGIVTAQKLLPVIFWPTFGICMSLLLFNKYIILFLYGKAFLPAAAVLKILSMMPMIIGLSNVWGIIVMLNLNLDKVYFRITTFCAVISILLNLIFIHYWSFIGSAIAWLLTESIGLTLIFISLSRLNIKLVNISYFNPLKFKMLLNNFKD